MEKKRKIVRAWKRVSFEESKGEDLMYWANLQEKDSQTIAGEQNKIVGKHILKDKYPEKIEKTGDKKLNL